MLLPWLEMGGADQVNLNIIKGLKKKYHFFILTTEKSKNAWEDEFEKEAQEIFHLTTLGTSKDYLEIIYKIIFKKKIDLVFISNSSTSKSILKLSFQFHYSRSLQIFYYSPTKTFSNASLSS